MMVGRRKHRRFFVSLHQFGLNVEMFTHIAQGHFKLTGVDNKNVHFLSFMLQQLLLLRRVPLQIRETEQTEL